MVDDERRAVLAENLSRLRQRVAAACAAAGRDPGELTVIAVTKTRPAADVLHLAELGVREVGENRDQEAAPKAAEVAAQGVAVRWHFVGRLQRNKCRSVAAYAQVVHAVDSVRLAGALAAAAAQRPAGPLDVLLQVSIDGDPGRGGVPAGDELSRLADHVAGEPSLRLRGVMAVAPLSWQPDAAFARLAEVAALLRARHPGASAVSAGMSNDLEAAIASGATHLRIGTALLGNRATLR